MPILVWEGGLTIHGSAMSTSRPSRALCGILPPRCVLPARCGPSFPLSTLPPRRHPRGTGCGAVLQGLGVCLAPFPACQGIEKLSHALPMHFSHESSCGTRRGGKRNRPLDSSGRIHTSTVSPNPPPSPAQPPHPTPHIHSTPLSPSYHHNVSSYRIFISYPHTVSSLCIFALLIIIRRLPASEGGAEDQQTKPHILRGYPDPGTW